MEGHAGQSDDNWLQLAVNEMKWNYDITLTTVVFQQNMLGK